MSESSIENFNRQFKAGSSTPAKPFPPFPPIPNEVKVKFPDLTEAWEQWQNDIAIWVKSIQAI